MPRRVRRQRQRRRSAKQLFRETGLVSIAAQETYAVGASKLEIPDDRSFTALSLSLQFTADGPIVIQVELWGPGGRPVWRSTPLSVGTIPVRRTYRWPARAAAMWPSTSSDNIFKIIAPCPGKVFAGSRVSIVYTVNCALSADYDQQVCPKTHGVIQKLADEFESVQLAS